MKKYKFCMIPSLLYINIFKAREDEICVSNGYTYRLEDYLNMLNNQSFNKERDILLLAKKY